MEFYVLFKNGTETATFLTYKYAYKYYKNLVNKYPNDHIQLLQGLPTKISIIFDSKKINKVAKGAEDV